MHLTSPFMSFNLFSATSRPGAHVGILLKSAEEYRWKRYVTRLSASRWRDQEVSAATELNNRLCEIYEKRIEHAPAMEYESFTPGTMQTPFEI